MIIALRGANGSGKSTIVRALMNDYESCAPVWLPGRRKPLGYELSRRHQCQNTRISYFDRRCSRTVGHDGDHVYEDSTFLERSAELFVPGHYEIANGGVDTLDSLARAYDLVGTYDTRGFHVVYEGKNATDTPTRVASLGNDRVIVVVLDVALDLCVESVRLRGHGISIHQIERVWNRVRREADELERRHFDVRRLDRESALRICRSILAKQPQPVL